MATYFLVVAGVPGRLDYSMVRQAVVFRLFLENPRESTLVVFGQASK